MRRNLGDHSIVSCLTHKYENMILISSSHIKPGKVVHICLQKCQWEDSEDSLDSQSRLLVESWVNEGHYQRNMVGSWGPTSKVNLLVSTHTLHTCKWIHM